MPERAAFVVDGFNLYHSIRDVQHDTGVNCRWLDLWGLCEAVVSSSLGTAVTLDSVHYFSAFANHVDPTGHGPVARHKTFKRAIESSGVVTRMGRFKRKDIRCSVWHHNPNLPAAPTCVRSNGALCDGSLRTHEEKESDVALACQIVELALTDACEHIVVMSGDTDLLPALRRVRALRPSMGVVIVSPYGRLRRNRDLDNAGTAVVRLTPALYQAHQLPDPFVPPDGGASIAKPAGW